MTLKQALIIIALVVFLPHGAVAASCATMTKELQALRLEYHSYATNSSGKSGGKSFDDLTKILDRIVELKNAMRKSECKIPRGPTHVENQEMKAHNVGYS